MDYRKGFWILSALLIISVATTSLLAIRYCRFVRLFADHGGSIILVPPRGIARIDELGAQIHWETDAKSYIEAAKAVFPGIVNYDEDRLARDEYAAVKDSSKRIPESAIVGVYNQHMQEMQAPDFTPITIQDLHMFREHYISIIYPRTMQLPNRTTPSDCRPVEALLVLHNLEQNGFDHDMRVLADTGNLPKLTAAEEMRQAKADHDLAARTRDAIDKYFASHKDWRAFANDTLNQLGLH